MVKGINNKNAFWNNIKYKIMEINIIEEPISSKITGTLSRPSTTG